MSSETESIYSELIGELGPSPDGITVDSIMEVWEE